MKRLLYILLFVPFALFGQEDDPCYSINNVFTQIEDNNPEIEINLLSGWNMIGYPCSQEIVVSDAFDSIVNNIVIVKDNNGNVYMPEFGFNGIGFLEGGQGYQIKMTDFVLGFTFCQSIQLPTIEGCTDCEASNFNQWANVDDGTCSYINIGSNMYGGIVFYYDSIMNIGFVAANSDLDGVYSFQCTELDANNLFQCADYVENDTLELLSGLGTGYQNTTEIISVSCSDENVNISASEATINFEYMGFTDWFLPSKDELNLMYNSIGNGSSIGNVGGFLLGNNPYWSSTSANQNDSWGIWFSDGVFNPLDNSNNYRVRPIRAFGDLIYGCIDEDACNYNSQANMADGSCQYNSFGYDCDGNFTEYVVGMQAQGGIVFYVDESGQHGLVVALENIGHQPFGCYISENESYLGSGNENTIGISLECENSVANLCLDYQHDGYDDWYLPSSDELYQLFWSIGCPNNLANFEDTGQDWYWTSTYWPANSAGISILNLGTGNIDWLYSSSNGYVRPIRSF